MKSTLSLYLLLFSISCSLSQLNAQDIDFSKSWLFSKGTNEGADLSDFDDSNWRSLDLPHDWAIEGPFSNEYDLRTGGLPVYGTGWYRKHFTVKKKMLGHQVSVEFDGAMNNAMVWVNGHLVGNRPNGYIAFEFDITSYLNFGGENVISVRLSPEELSARWYPGAGIYRHVKIKYNQKIHIPQWGTFVTTPVVAKDSAIVKMVTKIKNWTNKFSQVQLRTVINDASGKKVAEYSSKVDVTSELEVEQIIPVKSPVLWDLDSPYLYTAVSYIVSDDEIVDSYSTEFGIRTIEFTPNEGFKLNGKRVQLNGICMHHDLGPLGASENYRARERQMQIMKSMGANALRTSHNPPSPEWMQICDKLGFVVIVEAFDEWQIGKVKNGYNKYFNEWHERDLRDMIRCFRNHPSVIMWSIGNEILEQGTPDGWKVTKTLNDICHSEDITRPTTAGFNYYPAPFENKMAYNIDVVGLNYWPLNYPEIKVANPQMIIYGSETSSQTSSRGVYHLPIEPIERHETHQVSSYDAIVGPPWAYPPDVEFDAQKNEPASLGEFIWTGFDYLGEPTPYAGFDNSTNGKWNADWPSRSSYFAPVDLAGFPKDRFFLYQSQWTTEPMVHVLPHWNWEGTGCDTIPVFVYTNCDEAELFVNSVSMGRKVKGKDLTAIPAEFHYFKLGTYQSKYRLSWNVPYQPGELKVVAYKNGGIAAQTTVKTAGKPFKIKLHADRSKISADEKDLSFVTVSIEDENGNICPLADNLVKFEVKGAGRLAAVENGDPTATTSYQASERVAFNGLCLAIIKSNKKGGKIKLSAVSNDLQSAEIEIMSK